MGFMPIIKQDDRPGNIMTGEILVDVLQNIEEHVPVHPPIVRVLHMPLTTQPILGQVLQLLASKISLLRVDDSTVNKITSSIYCEASSDILLRIRRQKLWSSFMSFGSQDFGLASATIDRSFILKYIKIIFRCDCNLSSTNVRPSVINM